MITESTPLDRHPRKKRLKLTQRRAKFKAQKVARRLNRR